MQEVGDGESMKKVRKILNEVLNSLKPHDSIIFCPANKEKEVLIKDRGICQTSNIRFMKRSMRF